MSAKNVARLAESLRLTTLQKGGPFGAPTAVGQIDGFPVAAAWTQVNRKNAVSLLVRFKTGSLRPDAAALSERIAASPELLAAVSKPNLSAADRRSIQIGADFLRSNLHWSLRAPSPDAVAAALRALLTIVSGAAAPVGSACETCNASSGDLYCVDGVPTSICAACRERGDEEGRRRAEQYAAQPANPFLGTAAGLAACLVMAGLWGGVAYALERIFLYGAILMGLVIAWSVNRGMGKVNAYGRALAIGLTLGAVLLGDYLFILLSTAREWGESLSIEMARAVAAQFPAVEFSGNSSGWLSLLFGAVGAGYILWTNRAPALRRQMVPVAPATS